MKLLMMPCRQNSNNAAATNGEGVLPQIWATEGNLAHAVAAMPHQEAGEGGKLQLAASDGKAVAPARTTAVPREVLAPETAFYRSYTEAMLRRYATLSMESGRVPSMLGREMFRGKVTSYRVHAFDDVIIFCHDVEQCIRQLDRESQRMIHRIAVQEYTLGEAAGMFGISLRSVSRRYHQALDELTAIFLKRRLLERIASDPCQAGGGSAELVSHCPA